MPTKKNFLGGQQNYDPKNGEYRPSLVGKGGNVVTDADGDGIAHETKTRKFRDKNGKYWKTEERPEEETKTWGNDHTFLQQIDENGKEVYDYGSRGWHPNGMLKDYEELFDDANREGLAKKEDGWDFNEDSQTYTSKDGEVFSKGDYKKKFESPDGMNHDYGPNDTDDMHDDMKEFSDFQDDSNGESNNLKSDPLSEDNLHSMFKQGLTEDEVVNEIRKANPDIPNGDLQGAVEAFAMTNYPNQTSLNATLGKINQGKTKMNQVEPTKPKQLMNPSTPSYMSDQRYTRTKEALTKAGYKPKNEANPTNGYIEFEKPDGISFFYNTENGEIEDDGIRSWSADDFSGKTDSIMKETAGSMWGKNFKTEDDLQKAIDRSESRYQYSKQFYDEDVKEYGQYPTSGERYNLNDLVDAVNDSIDEINNYSRIAKKRGFNVKTKGGYEKINKRH